MIQAYIKIRLILWLIIAIVIAWFLYLGVVPSGKISYEYGFEHPDRFISKLGPADRVGQASKGTQKIVGNPAYFSLYTPRTFDTATLKLKYRANSLSTNSLSLIEAGILADNTVWRYNLQPIQNKVLDQLSLVWTTVREGKNVLLEKNKKYGSIGDFLAKPPDLGKVAVYNYDPGLDYVIKDYAPKNRNEPDMAMGSSLRGSWQFYTYIKNEKLDFTFDFRDLNQNRDADKIELFLYYNNSKIDSKKLDDDNNSTDNGQESGIRRLNLSVPGLPEGAYKLELKANDDIITEKISTEQSRLSFINKISFYQIGKDGLSLFTDARKVQAVTAFQEGLQTLEIGKNEFKIDATFKQFESEVERSSSTERLATVKLRKGMVSLSGRGVFAFGRDAFINPELKKADGELDVLAEGIEFVLASYQEPETVDGWKKAEIDFDLKSAYKEDGKYSFVISVPGLNPEDGTGDNMEIGAIEVDLKGKDLYAILKNKLKEISSRLFKQ